MKKVTIKKGWHRPFSLIPPFFRGLRFNRDKNQIIGKELLFDESCEYMLGSDDQYDWNKLYGWSFGVDGIHKNSIRFVWRYYPDKKYVEVAPYTYIDGKRILPTKEQIVKVKIGEKISTSIEVVDNHARLSITTDKCRFYDFHFTDCHYKVLFGAWFYFGGNRKAPHDITIRYKNIDNHKNLMCTQNKKKGKGE